MSNTANDSKWIEGNKLIAEFMDFYESGKDPVWKTPVMVAKDGQAAFVIGEMNYDSSWDWQIPVWHKFLNKTVDEYRKGTVRGGSNNFVDQRNIWENNYHSSIDVNSPKDGFDVLVLAIQWYNNQNKNNNG